MDFIHKMYSVGRVINDITIRNMLEKHLIRSEGFRRIQALTGFLKLSRDIKYKRL